MFYIPCPLITPILKQTFHSKVGTVVVQCIDSSWEVQPFVVSTKTQVYYLLSKVAI